MADAVAGSVLAETASNGDILKEEEGVVKAVTTEEENGSGKQRTEVEEGNPNADGEDYSETLGSKQEHGTGKGSEEPKQKRSSGEPRGKTKTAPPVEKSEGKASGKRKRLKKELATPSPSLFIDRPTRERKSIDRFVVSIEKEKVRELKIEKGAGTLLKDIPNVVYMVSKRKGSDDSIQLLHKLLYGKRMKPFQVKQNILQFSGYVWGLDQEKEKGRVKERLEKCNKDSLFQVCELLDLIISKSGKKEDLVAKLLEFLESPHKTTDLLIEEKPKGKRRRRKSQKGGKGTPVQTPRKRRKSGGTPKAEKRVEVEDDDKGDDSDEDEDEDAVEDDENEEKSGKRKRSREASDDEEYNVKGKKSKKKGRKSSKKAVAKETTSEESSEEEVEKVKTPVKAIVKSPSKAGKTSTQSSGKGGPKGESPSSKVFSRKKKQDEQEQVAKETALKEKLTKGRASNKSTTKENEKSKKGIKKFDPSDEELRAAICNLLEEADFSKDTFADVIKKLEKKFNFDLSQKKTHVKILIQEEISKIAEEEDGEEDEEENAADEEGERDKEDSDPGDVADQTEG